VAFARTADGEPLVATVVTRLALALERLGGWGEHTVVLPEGEWRDVLSGRAVAGGPVRLAELLRSLPVCLLVRQDVPAASS
jgi:(1->4)-alpha-D-glucan 1-alpha-D-glucosylmutase